jgi:hypothetical protein
MKIFTYITIVFLIFIIFSGCNKNTKSNDIYQYSGFDTLGVKIIVGSFSIEYGASVSISGEWNFSAIGNPVNIGPQTGEGEYIGTIENNELRINLNPEWDDNNVNLVGIIDGNTISGDWIYSGFPGIINYGTFTAKK